ncbi:hypothetical protein SAY87_001315 [Trapa incisa]|uniref:AB hydrolase-1 domain-containing protein n=1 Tax=Trapa incisa TaxID=236973 RepID=A0AAN7GKA1_9MYRT|nr:hypothetical protein SAY87_001315 [Trapa incisa]
MAVAPARRVSAASARSHTRKAKQGHSLSTSGVFKKLLLVTFIGFLAWAYQALQPPQPKIPGSPGGPPITAPRIKLRDGRHLAYKEYGVEKDSAKYKIVVVHGFNGCRHQSLFLSQELIDNLGVHLVSFDRPGYGESDPDPKRTRKSIALDIEELADQLGLGTKFYVIGISMGGQIVWGCLKYIPHRLAGVAMLAPVVNHWWSGIPSDLASLVYKQLLLQDQWALRVGHYAPTWFTYWWNTQKWFPSSAAIVRHPDTLSPSDKEILAKIILPKELLTVPLLQGEYESIHRDLATGFGAWEFSPVDLQNPFQNNEGRVHIWQGDEDRLVPVTIQRFIAQKLPWIKYHELPGAGHAFMLADGMPDRIAKALLLGETDGDD